MPSAAGVGVLELQSALHTLHTPGQHIEAIVDRRQRQNERAEMLLLGGHPQLEVGHAVIQPFHPGLEILQDGQDRAFRVVGHEVSE